MTNVQAELIEYAQVRGILEAITNPEHQAFLCLTYAALARVGEVVNSKRDKGCSENPPITNANIEVTPKKLVITILMEKTKKSRIFRKVPVSRKTEGWLIDPILDYSAVKQGYLFNKTTQWGESLFKKYFGVPLNLSKPWNIHLLRAWRATHLMQGKVTGKALPMQVVRRMGGWSNIATLAKHYDYSVIEDYERLII